MLRRIVRFFSEDSAQDLTEYALLMAFVAMAAAGILSQTGVSVQAPWSTATTTLATANGTQAAVATDPGNDHNHHDDHDHRD
jgi:Flp pilus assembly pilin Flp